jgi:DNA-directed RNA polymerase subunit RPC12/RpoP
MGRFLSAVKAGVAGMMEGTQPQEYAVGPKRVRCPHCGHDKFTPGRALLNTAGRTFFNLDWTDPSAAILVCAECGRIEWFAQQPDRESDQGGRL